jgi:AsmA protein
MVNTRPGEGAETAEADDGKPAPQNAWRRILWSDRPRGRAARIAALLVVVLGVGAAIAPWTVSRGALREEIAAQLRSSSGLYVFTTGPSTFSLLPSPRVKLEKIALVDPLGALVVEADRMSGQVRWLPLLAGRLELDRAELDHPRVTVDLDGRPMTTAGAAVRAADAKPATPEAAKADRARLGIVSFVDGSAILRRGGVVVDNVDHINATLDWRTVSSPASLDGEATWRGQRAAISLWVARPSDILRGETAPVTMQIRSPALKLSANGTAATSPRPQFEGRLVASTDSLRNAFNVVGVGVPLPLTLGAASLDGKADINANGASLSTARMKLDGADYEGTLAWRTDEARPTLSGTLAARSVDVGEALRYMPGLISSDGHVSREPVSWRNARAFDVDLRISATQATYGRTQLQDVAGALMLKDGKLELLIANANIYKGDMKARIVCAATEQGSLDFKANIQVRDIDWGAFSWDRFGDSHVSGKANAHIAVEGGGATPDQIARSLTGRGDIDIENGDVAGIDVERTLRRIEKRPLAGVVDFRSGRTPFDRARLSATIADGVATLSDGQAEGEAYSMTFAGAAQIAERQISLHAIVAPADSGGKTKADAPGFAFDVSGSWDNPTIAPDARSLIKRSGAAQPLFAPRPTEKPAD